MIRLDDFIQVLDRIGLYGFFVSPKRKGKDMELTKHNNLVVSIEATMFAVLAFVIALIPLDIGPFEVELGMIPIIILSYRRGWKPGILSGFLWGFIKLALGNFTMLSVLQVLIEYLFAFAVAGLAGIAWKKVQKEVTARRWRQAFIAIAWSTFLAVFVKYGIHFIAGVIYWSIYAPEGMNAGLYSFIINGASGVATFIIVGAIVAFIIYRVPRLIFPQSK